MIDVKVRLFGLFRSFGNGSFIELKVPPGVTVEEFRSHFVAALEKVDTQPKTNTGKPQSLMEMVAESVFANEERVLELMDRLEISCSLAILPPVCGG